MADLRKQKKSEDVVLGGKNGMCVFGREFVVTRLSVRGWSWRECDFIVIGGRVSMATGAALAQQQVGGGAQLLNRHPQLIINGQKGTHNLAPFPFNIITFFLILLTFPVVGQSAPSLLFFYVVFSSEFSSRSLLIGQNLSIYSW